MRLERLSHLASSPSVPSPLDKMKAIPPKLLSMYQALSTLPQPDRQLDTPVDPGKRQWETNKAGYVDWAVDRLLAKGGVDQGESRTVDKLGTAQELRAALVAVRDVEVAVRDVKADLEEAMDES
jgi:kinetochore protein Mis12/MTW1